MQYDIPIEPETPIEQAALRALQCARAFARKFREISFELSGHRYARLVQTLNRLEQGDLFRSEDEGVLELLEKAIEAHLNGISAGYGTQALTRDTRYDQLTCPELEEGRMLVQMWKAFTQARQQVIDIGRAQEIAVEISG